MTDTDITDTAVPAQHAAYATPWRRGYKEGLAGNAVPPGSLDGEDEVAEAFEDGQDAGLAERHRRLLAGLRFDTTTPEGAALVAVWNAGARGRWNAGDVQEKALDVFGALGFPTDGRDSYRPLHPPQVELDRAGQPIGDVLLNPSAASTTAQLVCRRCGETEMQALDYVPMLVPRDATGEDPDAAVSVDVDGTYYVRALTSDEDTLTAVAGDPHAPPAALWCPGPVDGEGHVLVRPDWVDIDWR